MCDPCNATLVVSNSEIRLFRWKKIAFFAFLSLLALLPVFFVDIRQPSIESPVISGPTGNIGCCLVTLSGNGTPGTVVHLLLNKENIGEATVNDRGEWSFETKPLQPGTYTALAYVMDSNGHRHQASRAIQFTVLPPSPPPEVRLATADLKPGAIPVTGTAEPGSHISLELNGEQVGEAEADDSGSWNFTLEDLKAGTYSLTAWAVDDALKKRTGSKALEFTIPAVAMPPQIMVPDGDLDPASITIQGTGTPGTTVELVRDGVTIAQVTVHDSGQWRIMTDVASYVTSFQAIGYSATGQELGRSKILRLKVPRAAELVVIGDPVVKSLRQGSDSRIEAELFWSGRGEPGTLLTIEGDTDLEQTVEIDDTGNWSISRTIQLPPGTYNLIARMKDRDGTLLDSSEPRQIIVNPPEPPSQEEASRQAIASEPPVVEQQKAPTPPTDDNGVGGNLQRSLNRLLAERKIEFELSSAKITERGTQLLDLIADQILAAGDVLVEISGHTDSSGDAGFNQVLSEKRAQAVREYLISRGIPADNLVAVGYGDSRPLVENTTLENRKINRRVEFRVLPAGTE